MTEVNFDNVGPVYKFWYSIFIWLENHSLFSYIRKSRLGKTPHFSDKWTIGNLGLSIGSLLLINYIEINWLSWILSIYAFFRIGEIIIYQINILVFHPYKCLVIDKKPEYKIQSPYRTVVLLAHNFSEIIIWFTCVSVFFVPTSDRLLYIIIDNTLRIFTFNYTPDISANSYIQIIFFIEVICGIILVVLSLAKFIGEMPHTHLYRESYCKKNRRDKIKRIKNKRRIRA